MANNTLIINEEDCLDDFQYMNTKDLLLDTWFMERGHLAIFNMDIDGKNSTQSCLMSLVRKAKDLVNGSDWFELARVGVSYAEKDARRSAYMELKAGTCENAWGELEDVILGYPILSIVLYLDGNLYIKNVAHSTERRKLCDAIEVTLRNNTSCGLVELHVESPVYTIWNQSNTLDMVLSALAWQGRLIYTDQSAMDLQCLRDDISCQGDATEVLLGTKLFYVSIGEQDMAILRSRLIICNQLEDILASNEHLASANAGALAMLRVAFSQP